MTNKNHVIAIATFKRRAGLKMLLDSIRLDPSANGVDIIVVDNDPNGSAHGVVLNSTDLPIVYFCEPRPGISAARNRALEYAISQEYETLSYVDDDEQVREGWFENLLGASSVWSADVVCGPVIPLVPMSAPRWIQSGGFFERPRGTTGGAVRWPATNNVNISLNCVGVNAGVRFSEEFSLTGGEDTDFFYQLQKHGARIIWTNDAVVTETVPLTRANLVWLWRRGKRLGNVSARILARRFPNIVIVMIAITRMLLGVPLVLLALLRGTAWGPAAMHLPKGVGMLQAVAGNLTQEYKR